MDLNSPKVNPSTQRPRLNIPQLKQDDNMMQRDKERERLELQQLSAQMRSRQQDQELASTEAFKRVKTKLDALPFSRKLLSKIIRIVMEDVESQGWNGEQAKQITLKVLTLLVCEKAPPEDKEWLLTAIDEEVVGEIIDIIILATKGELEVNHGTNLAKKCVPCSIKTILKKLTKRGGR